MACPKLEDLTFHTEEWFNIKTMVGVATARVSAGSPLRSIRIINCGELVRSEGKIELLRHVSHVETSFEISDVDFGVQLAIIVIWTMAMAIVAMRKAGRGEFW